MKPRFFKESNSIFTELDNLLIEIKSTLGEESKTWLSIRAYLLMGYLASNTKILPEHLAQSMQLIFKNLYEFYQCEPSELFDYVTNDIGKSVLPVYLDENVLYLDQRQRRNFLAVINEEGRVIRHKNGKKIEIDHLQSGSTKEPLFVISSDGLIYINDYNELDGLLGENINFHHSSFSAGSTVVVGGVIIIHDGKIKKISNESGHYQPNYRNILLAVQHLYSLGADISDTRIKIFYKKGEDALSCSAYTFLQEGSMHSLCSKDFSQSELDYHKQVKDETLRDKVVDEKFIIFLELFESVVAKLKILHRSDSSISNEKICEYFTQESAELFNQYITPATPQEKIFLVEGFLNALVRSANRPNLFGCSREVLIQSVKNELSKLGIENELFNISLERKPAYRSVPILQLPYNIRLKQLWKFILAYSFNENESLISNRNIYISIKSPNGLLQEKIIPSFVKKMLDCIRDNKLPDQKKLDECMKLGMSIANDKNKYDRCSNETKQFLSLFKNMKLFVTLDKIILENKLDAKSLCASPKHQ